MVVGILGIGGGIFGYTYYQDNVVPNAVIKQKQPETEAEKNTVDEDKTTESEAVLASPDERPEEVVYDAMHKMANTKIIAEDGEIWGEIPIDKESIKKVEDIVNGVNYEDRDYLLQVLKRWQEGDFSQIVDEHNYFWGKLDGNIGKAVGAK